jgi:hypothetical protein
MNAGMAVQLFLKFHNMNFVKICLAFLEWMEWTFLVGALQGCKHTYKSAKPTFHVNWKSAVWFFIVLIFSEVL